MTFFRFPSSLFNVTWVMLVISNLQSFKRCCTRVASAMKCLNYLLLLKGRLLYHRIDHWQIFFMVNVPSPLIFSFDLRLILHGDINIQLFMLDLCWIFRVRGMSLWNCLSVVSLQKFEVPLKHHSLPTMVIFMYMQMLFQCACYTVQRLQSVFLFAPEYNSLLGWRINTVAATI